MVGSGNNARRVGFTGNASKSAGKRMVDTAGVFESDRQRGRGHLRCSNSTADRYDTNDTGVVRSGDRGRTTARADRSEELPAGRRRKEDAEREETRGQEK